MDSFVSGSSWPTLTDRIKLAAIRESRNSAWHWQCLRLRTCPQQWNPAVGCQVLLKELRSLAAPADSSVSPRKESFEPQSPFDLQFLPGTTVCGASFWVSVAVSGSQKSSLLVTTFEWGGRFRQRNADADWRQLFIPGMSVCVPWDLRRGSSTTAPV